MNKIEERDIRKCLELNKQDKFILQLQQELIRERQIINNKNEEIGKLKEKIENMKMSYETDAEAKYYDFVNKHESKLQQRIDKAIEYVKTKNYCSDIFTKDFAIFDKQELLEILDKGE